MRKISLFIFVLVGILMLTACKNPPADDPVITGINLSDATGQGSLVDPFVFQMDEGDSLSANIMVSPEELVRNLKFSFVDEQGIKLSVDDPVGLELLSDNGNLKFSVKALLVGTFYVKISQDDLAVYVKVIVEGDQQPPEVDFTRSLKVLAIGNSFSQDALAYLYNIARDYGVENIVLGNLYIGGATLAQHAGNIKTMANKYDYQKNTIGVWIHHNNRPISYGLLNEDWDIITIQQASGKSGVGSSFDPHLAEIIAYVEENKTNPNAKILWHLTWAYQSDSPHSDFPDYNCDQMTMYNAIVSTYNEKVKDHQEVKGVIPAGTSIQNIRTSYIGDIVTSDGHHLNSGVGRYTAGLTWFKAITGLSIDDITFRPSGVSEDDLVAIKEAVNNAVSNPLEVSLSSYVDSEYTNVSNHKLLNLNWVLGYYVSTDSHKIYDDASNTKYFTTHNVRLSKENLPVGSVLRIESGYQYRINYFKTLEGDTAGNIRTNNFTTYEVIIDEAWWGEYNYVGFNVSYVGSSTDISDNFLEVSKKIKIYAAPGATDPEINHVDYPLYFVSGYWNKNATKITNAGQAFDLGFAASNVLSKDYLSDVESVSVASGFKIRVIFLTYDGKGYKVVNRTDNFTGTIPMDSSFWGSYEYVAFNISTTSSGTDLSGMLEELKEKLTFNEPADIPHVDEPLSFVSGYWADNATQITNAGGSFDLQFAASNIISKEALKDIESIIIAQGYQIRVIFLSYDGNGNYKVLSRTENLTGTIELNETVWGDYKYFAVNISTDPYTDLSEHLDDLPEKIVFNEKPLIPHVDEPLNFVSGYWADNAVKVTNTGSSFDLGFAASNVLSKTYFSDKKYIHVADGYQIRVILLKYDNSGGYTVLKRTDNFTGYVALDDTMWAHYEYMAFNISTVPSTDLSDVLDTLPSKLEMLSDAVINHVDAPLSFVSGYWADNATKITNAGGSFDLQFGASNIISKEALEDFETVTVAEGYRIRVIFLRYDGNGGYKVLRRTENLTGTINLDETFWSTYWFVAVNISTDPYTNLSSQLDDLPAKLVFE